MELDEAKAAVVRYAQRMEPDGLTIETSGNLSVRVGDHVAITPSGVAYPELGPESVCVCDLDGSVRQGGLAPSSELPMHLAVYRATGAGAIVHPHSLYATVLSTLVDEIPPVHYLVALFGGRVRVAPYATYGTQELAEAVVAALAGRSAALLRNHGSITTGTDIGEAYRRARYLEWVAQVHYLARLGGSPAVLDDAELERVRGRLVRYGQDAAGD